MKNLKIFRKNHTVRDSKLVPTIKFAVQLTITAIEFALPRAADENNSETKNQGIEPIKQNVKPCIVLLL